MDDGKFTRLAPCDSIHPTLCLACVRFRRIIAGITLTPPGMPEITPYWIEGSPLHLKFETIWFKDRLWVFPCTKHIYPPRLYDTYVITNRSIEIFKRSI